jgi:hypothetical protein
MFNTNLNILGFGSQPRTQINSPTFTTYMDGDYQVVKFYYQSGSTIAGNGSGSFILPYTRQIEYLMIGGGGSGGDGVFGTAAGGGAGQLLSGSFLYLANQQFGLTVGPGGVGYSNVQSKQGNNGIISTLYGNSGADFVGLTTIGGGGGGAFVRNGGAPAPSRTGISGSNGGSGGGAGMAAFDQQGGPAGIPGVSLAMTGSNGGSAIITGDFGGACGGGGGATQAGLNATDGGSFRQAGNGGSGSFSAISGSARFYAGGGGSGGYSLFVPVINGIGGIGGGGNALSPGENETGSGGGGGNGDLAVGGGTGVIILRWNTKRTNL